MVGPRIFQVGNVVYGAAYPAIHQDVTTLEEARSALIRIKAEGGPASFSYKNYNLPARYVSLRECDLVVLMSSSQCLETENASGRP